MTDTAPPSPPVSALGCAEVREALAAYTLGALDAGERAEVEAHLAGCPACRAALARHEGTVAAIAGAVPAVPPPAALRGRLLAAAGVAAEREPVAIGRVPGEVRRERRLAGRRAAVGLGLLAAALVVSVGLAGALWSQAREERDEAREQRRALAIYLDEVHEVLRNGGVAAPLVPVEPAADGSRPEHGTLIVGPEEGDAMVLVAGIEPDGDDGDEYRVWVARGEDRTGLDDLWVTDEGFGWLMLASSEPLASYDTVGITRVPPEDEAEREDLLVAAIPRVGAD